MKILHFNLKKQWYEMIKSGEKPEEYREIKPYWTKRLYDFKNKKFKPYTHVVFYFGYTTKSMMFEIEEMKIGKGNPKWGAPENDVYIIRFKQKYKNK